MDTSQTFVRKIRAKYGDKAKTDYGLAKVMGMKPQSIHNWKQRHSVFEDDTGYKIAELLELDPAYVLTCLSAERSKSENVKKTWERVAKVFQYAARTAAVILVGVVVFHSVPRLEASVMQDSVYYVKYLVLLILLVPVRSYRVNLKDLLS